MVMLETEVSSFTFGKKCEGFGNLFSTLPTSSTASLGQFPSISAAEYFTSSFGEGG